MKFRHYVFSFHFQLNNYPTKNARCPAPALNSPPPATAVPQEEVGLYQGRLLRLPSILVANKVDCVPDAAAVLQQLKQRTNMPILPISAMRGAGLERLKAALRLLAPTKPAEQLD